MIVTLIHGTWARGASWTGDGSAIRKTIQDQFNDVHFNQFSWSGANSHRARCRAAHALREHILNYAGLYPGQDHFLIAHSHGGNVALYALRDERLANSVNGVICLSTPFIHCRRRDLGAAGLIPVVVLGAICISLISVAGIKALWPTLSMQMAILIASVLLGGVTACLAAYSESLLRRLWGVGTIAQVLAKIESSFSFSTLNTEATFAVRAPGDEASGALVVSQFFSFLLTRVSRFINQLAAAGNWIADSDGLAAFGRLFRLVASCILALIFIRLWFHTATSLEDFVSNVITKIIVIPILVSSAWLLWGFNGESAGVYVYSATGALLLPVLVLLTIVASPFGFDTAVLAPIFEITAEATPPVGLCFLS